jgi:hypothetical protein
MLINSTIIDWWTLCQLLQVTLKVEKQRYCTAKYKVKIKFTVAWAVTPCIILDIYLRFAEAC